MNRIILHCDMNNAYASIEEMKNPELKEKIMVVGGSEEDRHGIVLAKNKKAKALGIKTGETLFNARIKAPDLVVVSPHFEDYLLVSKQARNIYYDFTNKVESFGIDECFLDITGSSQFGSDIEIARKIRKRFKNELGITISVGVSDNKTFAKLGSDLASYDETMLLYSKDMKEKIWPLPVSNICGIGRKTAEKLNLLSIYTIGELAVANPNIVQRKLGINGIKLWNMANGNDNREVLDFYDRPEIKSVGNGSTFKSDLKNKDDVTKILLVLAIKVADRLKKYEKLANGIEISVKTSDFSLETFQRKIPFSTSASIELYREALNLFLEKYSWNYSIRALTLRAIYIVDERDFLQTSLFCDSKRHEKDVKVDRAMYEINQKYENKITFASTLLDNKLSRDIHDVITLPTGFLRTGI